MLTLLHPELLLQVLDIPVGIRVLQLPDEERPGLVAKVPKEALLACKLNKGFKIYTVPFSDSSKTVVGLVSAFFDDHDEPLVVYTALFDEPEVAVLRKALLGDMLNVHLFDEHNREMLGYAAKIHIAPSTRQLLESTPLLKFNFASARTAYDHMPKWFGTRTVADDAEAIDITFESPLFDEDMFVLDARPNLHEFNGSAGFSHTTLVREEPGSFQEHDIVRALQRIFPADQIYLGPLRVTDKEEIADIVVVTSSRILLVQAKDSPNTPDVLNNTISRKRATVLKSMKKAIEQVRGAVRYCRSVSPLKMLVKDEEVSLPIQNLEMTSLIILKGMFNDQYWEYSPPLFELVEKTKVPCIALDYAELHMYTSWLHGEDQFFAAYHQVFDVGLQRGEFPRLRFGLIEG